MIFPAFWCSVLVFFIVFFETMKSTVVHFCFDLFALSRSRRPYGGQLELIVLLLSITEVESSKAVICKC